MAQVADAVGAGERSERDVLSTPIAPPVASMNPLPESPGIPGVTV